MQRGVVAALVLAAVALVAAPGASAALDLDASGGDVQLRPGETATRTITVAAYTETDDHRLLVDVAGAGNWLVTATPTEVILPPGATRDITIEITAADHPAPRTFHVAVDVLVIGGANITRLDATFAVAAAGTNTVLGYFDNPLPAPLDGAIGTFALSVVAWLVISLVAVRLVAPTLKALTARTKTDLDHRMVHILDTPAFVVLFTYGVNQSLGVFDLPAWAFSILDGAWTLVLAVAVILALYQVWNQVVMQAGARMASKTETDLDDRLIPVIGKLGGVVIVVAGILWSLDNLGIDMTVLAAGGVLVSMVIAFAAQDTLGNFFAGVFILLDQPFRQGDRIEIPEEQTWGDVVDIGLRSTRIRTLDNRTIIVPNAVIGNNRVVNHAYPAADYRLQTHVGVAYGTDLEHARSVLIQAARGAEGVEDDRPVEALFLEFADSALVFRVRWWIASYRDTRRMMDTVNTALEKGLREAGIEIPFPQRVVHMERLEQLR